jgi:hypothetical protein
VLLAVIRRGQLSHYDAGNLCKGCLMRDVDQLTPFERDIGVRLTNGQVINEITNRLRNNLESLYPQINKASATIHGYSLGGQFAQAFRFVLEHEGKVITIFAKICPVFESLDPAKKEYETLEATYNRMKSLSDIYSVSRPLIYFQDLNCYAMESVGVKDLRTVLLKKNSIFASNDTIAELKGYIGGSAEWLALFHEITAGDTGHQFDINNYLKSFTDEFNHTELSNYRFRVSVVDEIDKLFTKLSSISLPLTVPLARWHWDYTPGHVYVDNAKISVIDILGLENTPIYEDIGHFLASITSINNLPGYPLFNRKRSAYDFCDQFIKSYYLRTKLDKHEFMLLSNIYKLKYLIVYFAIQNRQINRKLGSKAGVIFANMRTVKIFEEPILMTISEIYRLLDLQPHK